MNHVFKILSFLTVLLLIYSCEPFYGSTIKNDSSNSIFIVLEYDKKSIEDAWGERPYIPFLKTNSIAPGVSIIDFDSINLISKYKVDPGVSFSVEHGQGEEPDYDLFKKIIIISNDTLVLGNRNEIKSTFEEVEKWRWELNIK